MLLRSGTCSERRLRVVPNGAQQAACDQSGSWGPHARWTTRDALCRLLLRPRSSTAPPGSRAGTAAPPPASRAAAGTRVTPGSWSPPAWPAARASPPRSPSTRAPSPPSPHPRSDRSTGSGRRACAVPAATSPSARTAGRCGATPATDEDDRRLGTPLCVDCYDYTGHVVWQWHAPELWRRFNITLQRTLARHCGLTVTEFRQACKISYSKVVEFQARGIIHIHVPVRLDGPAGSRRPRPGPAGHHQRPRGRHPRHRRPGLRRRRPPGRRHRLPAAVGHPGRHPHHHRHRRPRTPAPPAPCTPNRSAPTSPST